MVRPPPGPAVVRPRDQDGPPLRERLRPARDAAVTLPPSHNQTLQLVFLIQNHIFFILKTHTMFFKKYVRGGYRFFSHPALPPSVPIVVYHYYYFFERRFWVGD